MSDIWCCPFSRSWGGANVEHDQLFGLLTDATFVKKALMLLSLTEDVSAEDRELTDSVVEHWAMFDPPGSASVFEAFQVVRILEEHHGYREELHRLQGTRR